MPVGYAWALTAPKEPLAKVDRTWGDPAPGAALIEVHGCGVCHTDLGYADGGVAPKAPLPLVLGHEIVGRVVAVGDEAKASLVGRRVLAPSVSPCGECSACKRRRPTACALGKMPGNDADGGFATHVVVPSRDLFALDPLGSSGNGPLGDAKLEAWELAPVADAATTAWQAIVRAGLARDDVAVFVGAGGVGGFGVQLARSVGAHVIALDVDPKRLAALSDYTSAAVDLRSLSPRAVRDAVRAEIRSKGLRDAIVRVFETSGTTAGQEAAFELVERGGSLSIVGYTRDKLAVRLSNVMALDAEIYGNWGCDPALFDGVIERVLAGAVKVRPFVERRPLDDASRVLDELRAHALERRVVLVPDRSASA